MIDQSLLGSTVAKCMDSIESSPPDDDHELEVAAVGIVVILRDEEGSYTKTFCSDTTHYQQVGLFSVALECARGGE